MNCALIERDGRWFCPVCGLSLPKKKATPPRSNCRLAPTPPMRRSAAPDIPCVHRGGVVKFVACQLCGGEGRKIAVYSCALHGECALARSKDRKDFRQCLTCADRPKQTPPPPVTLAITAWQRPAALARLLASIDEHLPGWPVAIEDTRGNLSAGRNRLYGRVRTPYLVVMEEDFLVTRPTAAGLRNAIAILDHDAAIAGVGGIAKEARRGGVRWSHNFSVHRQSCYLVPSDRPRRSTPQGVTYLPCDLVLNWGVFRTDLFRRVPWDESFPITEHQEYFYRASRAGHEFAFFSGLTIDHLRDRPHATYNHGRNRNFLDRVPPKHGFRFMSDNQRPPPTDGKPNVVLLTVGCANSTLTVRQLQSLGWNAGDVDDTYAEHCGVDRVNRDVVNGRRFDREIAEKLIAQLPEPWVVKDPKFSQTLRDWQDVLAPYRPLLLYVTKDLDYVKQSYARRFHLPPELAEKRLQWCETYFANWPFGKLRLSAEQIGAACSLFDPARAAPRA